MRPEDIQRHINDNTIMTVLMRETVVTPHESENGKLLLEIEFPDWYTRYMSKESQTQLEALIRENAQKAYHATNHVPPDDDDPTR